MFKISNEVSNDTQRGLTVGGSAALLIFPLLKVKNAMQAALLKEKEAPSGEVLKKKSFFHGLPGFAAGFAVTTAIQTATDGIVTRSGHPELAPPAAAAASALFQVPVELMMVQQQKNATYWQTACKVYKQHGLAGFTRGMAPAAMRELFFTGAYLKGVPYVKKQLEAQGYNKEQAQLGAGLAVGSVAAVLSHPFDTLKTMLQTDLNGKGFAKVLLTKEAFAGLLPRWGVVAVAITYMGFANEQLK